MAAKEPRYAFCPACNKFQDKNFWKTHHEYCGDCGTKLVQECPGCHKPIVHQGSHCIHCGGKLAT
jgi:hypothetical protein